MARLSRLTSTRRTQRFVRAVLLAGALAGLALLGWPAGGLPSLADVRAVVDAAGPAGPLVYVAVYGLATVALVPGGALTVLAGLLFGPLLGTAVALTGASVGATAAFGVARRLGRARIRRLLGSRLQRVDGWLADRGFAAVLTLRLIPVVPFNVLNYAAGLTGVPPRAYIAATVLGVIPGAFAYAALGGTASEPLSAPFLGAAGLVVALTGFGALARRRLARARSCKGDSRACGRLRRPDRGSSADAAEAGGHCEREQRRDEEQQRQG